MLTIPSLFQKTVEKFSGKDSLAYFDETPLSYGQLNARVRLVIRFLEDIGITPGTKVAILSANMPEWGVYYLAIVSMGAVAVPLLPDFTEKEMENILNHSDSVSLVVSMAIFSRLKNINTPEEFNIIDIETDTVIAGPKSGARLLEGMEPLHDYAVIEDDLAAIIYTSGTTGFSKGVMLSHRNICFTAMGGKKVQTITEDDRFLSILPLSHTYENTIGFLVPLFSGSSVFYLRKPPVASVLIPALQKVRPTVMLTVPMIIEKVFRNKVLPGIKKNIITRGLYYFPLTRKFISRIAGKKLYRTFGGELKFFGIGGAKLNRTVEKFLLEADFPYAIGYGLTETAPLLAGCNPQNHRLGSTGPAMEGVEIRINNPDPISGEGEIWVKGANQMKGYYKEPVLTSEVITNDGWLKTGDLGVFDKDNFLYIKGRLKSVIIGSSGENIYPEEIESVINNFKHVLESLVLEKKGKLVAMVHFNYEELADKYKHLKEGISSQMELRVNELTEELYEYVNTRVNRFSRLQSIVAHPVPFQKTATQKIKRFLY